MIAKTKLNTDTAEQLDAQIPNMPRQSFGHIIQMYSSHPVLTVRTILLMVALESATASLECRPFIEGGRVMGRPKSDNPRNLTLKLRVDDEEVDMLEYVQRKTGQTKSEVIRNALRWSYVLEKAIEWPKSEKGKNDELPRL